jgi:hypothetical protein
VPQNDISINRILVALSKLVSRHERSIDDVAEALLCLIPLVEQQLPRCSSDGCSLPATHKHSELGTLACDRCCDKIVTGAITRLTGDMDDPVNLARYAAARRDMWIELEMQS